MNQNIKYNLLKTFRGGHQIADLKNYFKVTELFRKGLSQKQIRDKVNVSLDKLYRWRHTNSKPLFVKIMEEFEDRYNKIYSNKELEDIAYLIGYNLGDGNLSKNFCNTWFYGVYSDLFDIKKILLKFGVKPRTDQSIYHSNRPQNSNSRINYSDMFEQIMYACVNVRMRMAEEL